MAVLLKKPKFLLMYNACPGSNIYVKETEDGDWKEFSNLETADVERDTNSPNEGKDKGPYNGEDWKHCSFYSDMVENAEKGYFDNSFAPRFQSANYRLVYYPESQIKDNKLIEGATGTYTFPKGTHIAFFVMTSGQYALSCDGETPRKISHRHISFSRPIMNRYIGNTLNQGHSHYTGKPSTMNTGNGSPEDWTAFVTYTWNGQLMMGVEDYFAESEAGINGGDHDMNDMLFRVNGHFVREREEMNDKDPDKQSWLIACEDLGGTYDFDFNDVVFGVTHVAGETEATVTALASGGTLPVYLWSQYPQIGGGIQHQSGTGYILAPEGSNGGEFHSWWGSENPHHQIINATGWHKGEGKTVRIQVDGNFSLASDNTHSKPGIDDNTGHMGGFKVLVHKADGETAIEAPQYGKEYVAPQMFLVPSLWKWPHEQQNITKVYTGFSTWLDKWWEKRDGEQGGNVIHHGWSN